VPGGSGQRAGGSGRVYLRTLIAQLKIAAAGVLHTSDEDATRAVMISLGHCIRNNAATNIFNKDLIQETMASAGMAGVSLRLRCGRKSSPTSRSAPTWIASR
jgi:hypothetical protein